MIQMLSLHQSGLHKIITSRRKRSQQVNLTKVLLLIGSEPSRSRHPSTIYKLKTVITTKNSVRIPRGSKTLALHPRLN